MYEQLLGVSLLGSCAILGYQYVRDVRRPRSLTAAARKASSSSPAATATATAARHCLRIYPSYVVGCTLLTLGDWVQGPYLFAMYDSFGYNNRDIAVLNSVDYVCAMACGLIVGGLTDTSSPLTTAKAACVAYGVLYAISCFCNHFSGTSFAIVALGCALDGVCNALLRTSFETWLVRMADKHRFSKEESWVAFVSASASWWGTASSLAAGLLCFGVVASVSSAALSTSASLPFVATMDVAAAILLCGAAYVAFTWESDADASVARKKAPTSALLALLRDGCSNVATGYRALRDARSAAATSAIVVEVLFETTLLLFLGVYPSTIAATAASPASVPFGLLFAVLLSSMLVGTTLATTLINLHAAPRPVWRGMVTVALGAAALVVGGLASRSEPLVLVGFCLIEVCFGVYYAFLPIIHDLYATGHSTDLRGSCVGLVRVAAHVVAIAGLGVTWWTNSLLAPWLIVAACCAAAVAASFRGI